MEQELLFNQKKAIAKNSLAIKTQVHGLRCEVEIPTSFESSYGEDSGHITYKPIDTPTKVVVVNSTQETMKTLDNPLSSTENPDIYISMFEDDILPRNSRIKIYMQDNSYRQLKIGDNLKNEGTFVVYQKLVPCINTVDDTDPNIGNNLEEELPVTVPVSGTTGIIKSAKKSKPVGNNL